MFNKPQDQNLGDNSKGLQAGRDTIDNSKHYYLGDQQEKKDFGIIEEIFEFLFKQNANDLDLKESSSGKGLKKIPLNFSGDSLKTINEIALKTTKKRGLVGRFINDQREIDESKVDALIIKFQDSFRDLKGSASHYKEIEDVKIITDMAKKCISLEKTENADYFMNALAIVLYFFEMCDFGKSEEEKEIQEPML